MYYALQPRVFALSGWDLCGMLTHPTDAVADLLESGPHRLRSRRTSPGHGGPGRGGGPRSGSCVWSSVRTIQWTAWDPCDRNRCHALVGPPELAKVLWTRRPMATRRTAFAGLSF